MVSGKRAKQLRSNSRAKRIIVINVTGNIPGVGVALLQTAYDATFLKQSISSYLVRSFESMINPMDILEIQKILHIQANKVPELLTKNRDGNNIYDFESNQRLDELMVLLAITTSTNQMNRNRGHSIMLVPAWQRPNQGIVMKRFNGKGSWDGFMHEYVPLGTDDTSVDIPLVPVEIKSLMINPNKEKYANLNDLLDKKTPDFSQHFQLEGSICAVVVMPYVMNSSETSPSFDIKKAAETINKHVTPGAIGCLLFFGLNDKDGATTISIMCHFVSKKLLLGANGKIDHVDLFKLVFGKFENKT